MAGLLTMGDVAFPTNQRNVALSPDDAHPLRECVVHHQSMCCWRDSTFSRWREQQSTFFCCPQSEINAVFGSDALGLRSTSPLAHAQVELEQYDCKTAPKTSAGNGATKN